MAKPAKPARHSATSGRKNAAGDLQGIQSVETGLSVLTALVDGRGPMTLGEVARGTGLSLSQARRYLVSLVRSGFAVQESATGRYDLGSRSLRVGLAALARVEGIELATAALKELVARIDEGGTLAVWGDEGPTIVRWLRGGGIGVTSLGLGTIFPLLSSATGRVFLAHLSARSTRAQLERELGDVDPSSPKVAARIEAIRSTVRKAGFAWLKGHFLENIRGAAAPVFDSQGELVAVVAIAGPDRRDANGRDASVDALVDAAQQVTRQLSG
jgi:DNA-binding IclR family transcriptional regulator